MMLIHGMIIRGDYVYLYSYRLNYPHTQYIHVTLDINTSLLAYTNIHACKCVFIHNGTTPPLTHICIHDVYILYLYTVCVCLSFYIYIPLSRCIIVYIHASSYL